MQALLTETEVAGMLKVRPVTLRAWRQRGGGPRFRKIGAAVRYAAEDLEAFVEAAARTSTSDPGPPDGSPA